VIIAFNGTIVAQTKLLLRIVLFNQSGAQSLTPFAPIGARGRRTGGIRVERHCCFFFLLSSLLLLFCNGSIYEQFRPKRWPKMLLQKYVETTGTFGANKQ